MGVTAREAIVIRRVAVAMMALLRVGKARAQQYLMLDRVETRSYRSTSSRAASNCTSKNSSRNQRWNRTRSRCSIPMRGRARSSSTELLAQSQTSCLNAVSFPDGVLGRFDRFVAGSIGRVARADTAKRTSETVPNVAFVASLRRIRLLPDGPMTRMTRNIWRLLPSEVGFGSIES